MTITKEEARAELARRKAEKERSSAQSDSNLDSLRNAMNLESSPGRIVQDIAAGLGSAGQDIASTLTHGYAPKVNMGEVVGPKNAGFADELMQGLARYAPFGMAAPAGFIGQTGAGAVSGFTQGGLGEGLLGGGVNALTHGLFKGLEALRPSKLFRGKLTPEELRENVELTKETPTQIGEVVESPFLKRQYENILSKNPLSGAVPKMEEAANILQQRGKDILGKTLGVHEPETATANIHKALMEQFEKRQLFKNQVYGKADNRANEIGLKLELPKFAEKANKMIDAIEQSHILKTEPDMMALLKKLKNYKEPVKNIESSIVSASGEPLISRVETPTLKEANLLKGRLNHYANVHGQSPDPAQRNLSRVFSDLAKDLRTDIHKSVNESGDTALKKYYHGAEENYAKNFSPFLDRDIYKYIGGKNADSDLIVQSFIKTSPTSDRANLTAKLASKLPEEQRKLLLYSYLSPAINKEGELSTGKLSTLIDKLGKNQFKALVNNSELAKELLNYSKLYKKNIKAVNLMQNPPTGQQSMDRLMPWAIAHTLSGGLGALAGVPGAIAGGIAPTIIARQAVKWMTSPESREKLVEKMINPKELPVKAKHAQGLAQALIDYFNKERK